jgi:proline dehydrogenase
MSILSKIIVASLPIIPKGIVGYFAKPYIAGDSLSEAIKVVKELNADGIMATMDVLGESVSNREESIAMRNEAEEVLHAIHEHKLDATLSLKPTQMGLSFDEDFCEENIRVLCTLAKGYDNSVCIDMEDHPYTDSTFRIYDKLRRDFPGNVTCVIQSYMKRSPDDMRTLVEGPETNLRLCKGIYVEPEEIAYQEREKVRDNYKDVLRIGLKAGAFIAVATHDDPLIEDAINVVNELKLNGANYEFQMLLGVRPKRRDDLVKKGYPMRIYVPFGERWYAYSTRRLKENPNMAMHIVKALFRINQ